MRILGFERFTLLALGGALLAACNNPSGNSPSHQGHASAASPASPASAASPASPASATRYVCPMHPEVTDTKASDCPKCGMKLVPVSADGGPGK